MSDDENKPTSSEDNRPAAISTNAATNEVWQAVRSGKSFDATPGEIGFQQVTVSKRDGTSVTFDITDEEWQLVLGAFNDHFLKQAFPGTFGMTHDTGPFGASGPRPGGRRGRGRR